MVAYFFDTYALFGIINGNKNYLPYTNCGIVLTKLNLIELYYGLIRDFDETIANKYFTYFRPYCIDIDNEDIKYLVKVKLNNKKLSYCDALGYTISLRLNIMFLTGDKEFESMDNVQYVK